MIITLNLNVLLPNNTNIIKTMSRPLGHLHIPVAKAFIGNPYVSKNEFYI